MQGERVVGGIRCSEVLADLSEYVDGRLDPEQRRRIEVHVGGCRNCESFGGSFGKVVASIREEMTREKIVDAAPTDPGVELADRLMRGLDTRGSERSDE